MDNIDQGPGLIREYARVLRRPISDAGREPLPRSLGLTPACPSIHPPVVVARRLGIVPTIRIPDYPRVEAIDAPLLR